MGIDDRSNVIDFSRYQRPALFGKDLRGKIEVGLKRHTDAPEEAVATVEQIICTHIVGRVRFHATEVGTRIGHRLADWALGKQ
jgi:hypothetical protein